MPSQPKRLVDLAMQVWDGAPWHAVTESCVFLIKVPGQSRPLGCTVFGAGVDIKGVEISLSPNGFRRYLELHNPETAEDEIEAWKPGRSLSAVFLLKHQVAPEFRKVWKAAGFKTAGHPLVPQFAGTEGDDSGVRAIKRSEGTILGYCLHAILEASRGQRLAPPDAADRLGVAQLLTVHGDDPAEFEEPDLPSVSVSMVPWPDDLGRIPEVDPMPEDMANDIRSLPSTREGFAFVTLQSGGSPENGLDDGDLVAVLLERDRHDPGAGGIPEWHPVVFGEPEMLSHSLLHLLQAAGRRPATIATEDATLAAWLHSVEGATGIRPEYYEFEDDLALLADHCVENLGGTAPARHALDAVDFGDDEPLPPDEFPAHLADAADWAKGHAHVGFMVGAAATELGLEAAAVADYWGTRSEMQRVLELVGFMGAGHAFRGYYVEDARDSTSGLTAVELTLEAASSMEGEDAPSKEEIECYHARRDSVVSVFRIRGGEVVDVLDEERHPIDVEIGSISRFDDHVMMLRHYRLGPYHAFAPAGPALADEAEDHLLQQIEEALGAPPTHELLRGQGAQLGRLWKDLVGNIESALKAAQGNPSPGS